MKHDGSVHYSMSPMLNPVHTEHSTMTYVQYCYDIFMCCHFSVIYIPVVFFEDFQFLNVHFQGNTLVSSSALIILLWQQNLKLQQYRVYAGAH